MGDVVITIPHPESAIVIGAVYDAIRGSVESRKSRENWGLEVMMPWDSTKHTSLHSKKTIDGKNYAQNCYFPITQKASIVGVTDYIEYEFKTVNPYQSVMKFNFLSSKDDIVSSNTSNIITQGTCQILVPLENPGDGRTLALRIFNGTSEINYQIYDRNNKAAEGTLMLKSIDTTAKHFIFAFDNSGSMDDRDITPSSSYQSNRLGTVLESFDLFIENLKKSDQTNPNNLYSVVSFDHYSTTWMKHMNLDSVPNSSSFDLEPSGGTAYRSALENIYNDVLEVPKPSSSSRSSMINELAKKNSKTDPVILFLSDGEDQHDDLGDILQSLKQKEPKLKIFTISFGPSKSTKKLIEMASFGGGYFFPANSREKLIQAFEIFGCVC